MSKLKGHRIPMIKGRDIEFYCNGIVFIGNSMEFDITNYLRY